MHMDIHYIHATIHYILTMFGMYAHQAYVCGLYKLAIVYPRMHVTLACIA